MHKEDMTETLARVVYFIFAGYNGEERPIPYTELPPETRARLRHAVTLRMERLCAGGGLKPLVSRNPEEDFNLGICTYFVDQIVLAAYRYTLNRLPGILTPSELLDLERHQAEPGGQPNTQPNTQPDTQPEGLS